MQLGEILNENNVEVSNRERIYLGLYLRASIISDVAQNPSLRNETKTLLREICVEYGLKARKCSQSKVKMKQISIEVEIPSTKERNDDIGWLEDQSDDDTVENTPKLTSEETEKKMKYSINK